MASAVDEKKTWETAVVKRRQKSTSKTSKAEAKARRHSFGGLRTLSADGSASRTAKASRRQSVVYRSGYAIIKRVIIL
jgi:hypothetical protein